MILWLIVGGIAVWFLVVFLCVCLAKAAGHADERLGYKVPPSPILRYGALSRHRATRAAKRAGYLIDPQDRKRLGLD